MSKLYLFILLAFLFVGCSDYEEMFEDRYGCLDDGPGNCWVSSSSSFPFPVFSSSELSSSSESSSSVESSSSELSSSSEESSSLSSSSLSSSSAKSSSSSVYGYAGSYGTLADSRDDQIYKTVEIDGQTWMAENLKYAADSTVCFAEKESNCQQYGRYYSRDVAMTACPAGWRLPIVGEYLRLFAYAKTLGKQEFYDELASLRSEKTDWAGLFHPDSAAVNKLGFSALPLGVAEKVRSSGSYLYDFHNVYYYATFMTATIHDLRLNNLEAKNVWLAGIGNGSFFNVVTPDKFKANIRCVKDDGTFSTFKDERDDVVYKTVRIGSQTWMAENLKAVVIKGETTCLDNSLTNCSEYGRFYSWKAAENACPAGWHLPSKEEFVELYDFIKEHGYGYEVGESLMDVAAWNNGERKSDLYGFTALPVGYYHDEIFSDRKYAIFWSSTKVNSTASDDGLDSYYGLYLNESYNDTNLDPFKENYGASVRCIKD